MNVQANRLSVGYGSKPILTSLDFHASASELTVIVGPNGSGKSTLLKALCGDLPYAGKASLNGLDIAATPSWKMAGLRGVLPQASTLAFPFSALEVVRIGLTSGNGAQHCARAERALEKVGLLNYAHRFYQELSGGEQQRVQLARVLAQVWAPCVGNEPHWLMLDEPVSSLDIAHQLEVMRLAREFASGGGGVIAVMHDLNLTGLFADKVIVMSQGQIVASGDRQSVMCDSVLSRAYGCSLRVNTVPDTAAPFVLPHPTENAGRVHK